MHYAPIDAIYHEACEIFNPGWDGEAVSELHEALVIVSNPISIALLILSALPIWRGSLWLALTTSFLWAVWTSHIFVTDMMDDPRRTAADLGCIGHSTLFIGLAIALCAAMTLYTAYLRLRRIH